MLNSGFAFIAVAALLAGAALQVVLALAGFRARRMERNQAAVIRDLQKDMLGLQQELAGLRLELRRSESGVQSALPTVSLPAVPAVRREPVSPAYEMASRLARKGASGDDLMETCGLSRGEVDLITRFTQLGQGQDPKRKQGVSA